MSFIKKITRVLRSHYRNVLSGRLTLPDGTYETRYHVKHYTERCGWEEFGAKDAPDYEYWWQEACGIVALQTVTSAIKPTDTPMPTIFEQIQSAIKDGAYLEYKNGKETVRVGWIHHELVAIGAKRGAKGYSASLTLNAICQAITKNELVIASVYRPFVRFIEEGAPRKKRGGHLIVIKGFAWKNGHCIGLYVEDPYDIDARSEPIHATLFEAVYSGSAITFHA